MMLNTPADSIICPSYAFSFLWRSPGMPANTSSVHGNSHSDENTTQSAADWYRERKSDKTPLTGNEHKAAITAPSHTLCCFIGCGFVRGLEWDGEAIRIARWPLSLHDMFALFSRHHQGATSGNELRHTEEQLLTVHVWASWELTLWLTLWWRKWDDGESQQWAA